MKYLITIFLFLTAIQSFSQQSNKSDDSLKKYSYYLGFKTLQPNSNGSVSIGNGNGTGFFIRDEKGLYLITARHNVVPCDEKGNRLYLIDLFFWLQDANGTPTIKISIDNFVRFNNLSCKKDTDAIAIKVDKTLSVYSVDSFMTNIPTEFEDVEVWGYPENKNDTSNRADYQLISNTHLLSNSYSFEIYHDSITNTTDWVNSLLVSKLIKFDNSRHGYSGSPVFMKDKKSKKWVFVGLNFGHGDFGGGENYLHLVRPNIIINKVNEGLY